MCVSDRTAPPPRSAACVCRDPGEIPGKKEGVRGPVATASLCARGRGTPERRRRGTGCAAHHRRGDPPGRRGTRGALRMPAAVTGMPLPLSQRAL